MTRENNKSKQILKLLKSNVKRHTKQADVMGIKRKTCT